MSGFDLRNLPDDFSDNPHPHYAALRNAQPVYELPGGGLFLSRHADLMRVYKDRAVFSSDKKVEFYPKFGDSLLYEHHTTSLVFNDAPLHTRVRKAIAGALSPRAIAGMDVVVGQLVDRLLDDMAARQADGKPIDAVADFAQNIPIEVIGNLLAIPRAERDPLRDWSLAILGALEPEINDAQFDAGEAAVRDFLAYLQALVARRQAEGVEDASDIMARLIRETGAAGEDANLLPHELLQNCIFILNAGHETDIHVTGIDAIHDGFSALHLDDVEFDAIGLTQKIGNVGDLRRHGAETDGLASLGGCDDITEIVPALRGLGNDTHLEAGCGCQWCDIRLTVSGLGVGNHVVAKGLGYGETDHGAVIRHTFHLGSQLGATTTGDLLGNDGPAMAFFEFFGDHAGLCIGTAACGKADHHGDGPRRLPFGERAGGGHQDKSAGHSQRTKYRFHCFLQTHKIHG